ncbi:hypothetical protein QBC38DRAFT_489515 [Podospora fimiseda]|uniref:Hydrophobin n=1 Tax=Podospora fimiseda TaxID=252190 RepID=A0AAN6YNK7_9PEZI|nr:hypothetical protein QBC38DRAFT_489515 [Podospora fimiseda]
MKFFAVFLPIFAGLAAAAALPAEDLVIPIFGIVGGGTTGSSSAAAALPPCSTGGKPMCCSVDVLDLAELICDAAPGNPETAAGYRAACASISRKPKCCTLKVGSLLGAVCSDL